MIPPLLQKSTHIPFFLKNKFIVRLYIPWFLSSLEKSVWRKSFSDQFKDDLFWRFVFIAKKIEKIVFLSQKESLKI